MASLIAFFRSHHKQRESISLGGLSLIFRRHFWINIEAYSFTYFNCFFLLQFSHQKKKINLSPKDIQQITAFRRWKKQKIGLRALLSQQIIFSRSLQLQPSNSGKFLNENMLVPPTSWIYIFHYLLLNSWGKLIISLDVNISYNGDSIFFINSLYYKAAAFLFFFSPPDIDSPF